jgi:acyl-CoA thioester hydrolase
MLTSVTTIPVRYAETDQMGVVHHSNYPIYFEAGRTEFFQQHLMPYPEMEKLGLFAPVLSYEVSIKGRASYGHTLSVETRPAWMKGVRVAISYRVTRDGLDVASGSTVHALVGADMKPVHPRSFGELYPMLTRAFAV